LIRVGVIGYGYWGPNLVRNFAEADGSEIAMVSDLRENRLSAAKKRYPNIKTTRDFGELINAPGVDAVAVAPMLDNTEALKTEAEHFIRCVEGKETPLTDGKSGWRVVRILEAASSSLSNQGKIVELDI